VADPTIKDLAYRGLASVLGGPVDLATMVMRPFGYKVPDQQVVLGSEWIGKKMEDLGLVSTARAPLQEFAASMIVPSPDDLYRAAAMAPALIGSIKKGAGKVDDMFKNLIKSSKKTPILQGTKRLYHAGSDPTKGGYFSEVPSGGAFDGFFALENGYGNYGTGAKYFSDIPENKILSDYDLNYNIPYKDTKAALDKAVKNVDDDDFDILWRSVIEDKSNDVDEDDLMRIFGVDDIGEAQWEAQRLRGQVAKNLGFNAVEMSDENGTSYLIVSGTKLIRDSD
jgi:hypothetical protein